MRQGLNENLRGRKLAARINEIKNEDLSALNNRRIQAINEGQETLANEISKKINSIAGVRQAATDGARYQTFTNTAGPIADVFKGLVKISRSTFYCTFYKHACKHYNFCS